VRAANDGGDDRNIVHDDADDDTDRGTDDDVACVA
jgi:hypothetical protein